MIGETDNMLPAIGIIMILIGIISFFVGMRRENEPVTTAEEEHARTTDSQLENREETIRRVVDERLMQLLMQSSQGRAQQQQLVNQADQENQRAAGALARDTAGAHA